jgi:2-iminobutanoate/2-iminopropanoate deaminase
LPGSFVLRVASGKATEESRLPRNIVDTPSAPAPMAPYSSAVEANGFVFMSGQVAIDPVTGERTPDDCAAQTHRVMKNIGLLLEDAGLRYEDIVKTTLFLADISNFPSFNEVYGGYFESDPPARSTFQAGALPGGFLVEIEAVAAR